MTNKENYINQYNKSNYKMYQFRVKKTNTNLIEYLDNLESKNKVINDMLDNVVNHSVLTLKELKSKIKKVTDKYNIDEVYLFGSYARGEATPDSDVDIYCSSGDVKTLYDLDAFEEELENELGKKVDVITIGSKIHPYVEKCIKEDLIKLC